MPRRKQKGRSKRMNDQTIHRLREVILTGFPWRSQAMPNLSDDEWRLLCAVTGQHCVALYFIREYWGSGDGENEMLQSAWEFLKNDIIGQHIKYRPGTRPAPWWDFEALELRRVVGSYPDEDGPYLDEHGRRPAGEIQDELAEHCRGFVCGVPKIADGYVYESERAYLERLNLLSDHEKQLFAKYNGVALRVHVAQGEFGKCESCWEEARVIARDIDFNLDDALKAGFEMPWLPGDLLSVSSHAMEMEPDVRASCVDHNTTKLADLDISLTTWANTQFLKRGK